MNVYNSSGETRAAGAQGSSGKGSGGVGQDMQAARHCTDVREQTTAGARPRPSTPVLSLAPTPSQTGATSLDRQRARRLVTAAEAVRKHPFEGLNLGEVSGRAALAREAIAEHQQGSEACQLEAFEQALALATERASLAFYAQLGTKLSSGADAPELPADGTKPSQPTPTMPSQLLNTVGGGAAGKTRDTPTAREPAHQAAGKTNHNNPGTELL